jgi:pimeloyl-ACP methyl ester carboxylesterase
MLHALPGMGGDHRMYLAPWTTLPGLVAHDWMPYAGESTLEQVAASMIQSFGIREGDSLIGTSLGGMVAVEIAQRVRLRQLVLVASALHPREVSRTLKFLHPLAKITPWRQLQRGARTIPVKSPQMFARNDPDFLKTMCRAVFQWRGSTGPDVPTLRLHGRFDPIISRPSHADHWIQGGHRINETHAGECVEWIRPRLLSEPN